jgi:uncharacterized phage-associated protein
MFPRLLLNSISISIKSYKSKNIFHFRRQKKKVAYASNQNPPALKKTEFRQLLYFFPVMYQKFTNFATGTTGTIMTTLVFNLEKSLHTVLYVAERLERKDFHKVFKVLYFADRSHLAKYGRSITGDTYIKMMNGPVPSNIYDIFKSVKGDSIFSRDNAPYLKLFSVEGGYFIKPHQKANLDYLSETDVEELNASLSAYGSLSFEKLKELSHDFAWSSAPDDCPIDVINILREAGQEDDYIRYLNDIYEARQSLCN